VNNSEPSKSRKKGRGKRNVKKELSPLSLAPLTVEEAVTAMFAVRPPDKDSGKRKSRGTS
jgi:hypothetical protein